MKNLFPTSLLAIGTFAALPITGNGATIVDHFSYGGTSTNLAPGLDTNDANETVASPGFGSAGGGWAGGWTGSLGPNYVNTTSLSYSDPNYSNGPNGGNGIAAWGNSGGSGSVVDRAFSTALTGTVWISVLAKFSSITGETLLHIDRGDKAFTYIGINSQSAIIRDVDQSPSDTILGPANLALDTVHLLLARITIDATSTDDMIELWTNPDLSSGAAGLGTATVSFSGTNSVGDGLNGIGVGFRRGASSFDSIRISNDVDGFSQVTSVPEPSAGLLAFLGLAFLSRRKR